MISSRFGSSPSSRGPASPFAEDVWEGAEDATPERAVLALGFYLTTEEAGGILRSALRTRRETTARACLRALGQRRGAGVVATLAKVVAVEKPELAAVAAELADAFAVGRLVVEGERVPAAGGEAEAAEKEAVLAAAAARAVAR